MNVSASAANELKQLFQSPSLRHEFDNRRVQWEFISKRAPWYWGGGVGNGYLA